MPRIALTDRFVAGVKQDRGQRDHFDSHARGLALRVADSGLKTWCLFFTSPRDGRRTRSTIGRYPEITLAEARARALEARQHLSAGIDPRDVAHGVMTVRQLVEAYLVKRVRPRLRSAKAVHRRLFKNMLPVIGGLELGKLHKRDVKRALDPLVGRGAPSEAVKCFKDVRAALNWAVEEGYLDVNPLAGMKAPALERVRDRVLSDSEIRTVWNTEALRPDLRSILRLCLLTAQRVGEVAGMCADEIDLAARAWTIPGPRSKNKHSHIVPLSAGALEILKAQMVPAAGADGRLFPDAGDTSSIGKALQRANLGVAHFTAHDLRRTATSGMAELGVAPIVLAHVLHHISATKAGVTLSVYARYDYAKEQRQALGLWADRIAGIVGGEVAAVLPLRGRA